MLIVKLLGILFIVVSCAFIGFLKSHSLAERCKKLSLVYDGASTLHEYVEKGGCELAVAIKNSFSSANFLRFENGILLCDDNSLTKQDSELINGFFSALGTSVKKIECDKINTFKLKLNLHIKEAETNLVQKGKIYQTFGICIGLTLAVLFI